MADKKMLGEFARRAQQRLKDKKVNLKFSVFVPSLEQEFVFRSLGDAELMEIFENDALENGRSRDQLTIYEAAVEPSLKELAQELLDAGDIKEYVDVVGIFSLAEQQKITKIILQKSGMLADDASSPRLVEKALENAKN